MLSPTSIPISVMNAPKKANAQAREQLTMPRKRLFPSCEEIDVEKLFTQVFISYILSTLFDLMEQVCHGCSINHGSQVRELVENTFFFYFFFIYF